MSFALWWALTYSQSALMPLIGGSYLGPKSHLWAQTSLASEGVRSQLTASIGSWSLKYGSQNLGWGWSLDHRGSGLWWSPRHGLGILSKGHLFKGENRVTYQLAAHRSYFVGRLNWNGISLQQNLGGSTSISAQIGPQRIEASYRQKCVQVGLRSPFIDVRWAQGPSQNLGTIRVHRASASLEYRRQSSLLRNTNQIILTAKAQGYHIWLHGSLHDQKAELSVRTWLETRQLGRWFFFIDARTATARWSPVASSRWEGSYLQLGTPTAVRVSNARFSLTGEWERDGKLRQFSISSRIPFHSVKRASKTELADLKPSWLNIALDYRGELPPSFLELSGSTTHRIKLAPQNRQWNDHIPPGTYAVRGITAKGWTIELSTDSITLNSGHITQIDARISRPDGLVRWISASGAAAE